MENSAVNKARPSIHKILAHSYATHFLFFLLGIVLDLWLGFKIFSGELPLILGFLLLGAGTALILWAQGTSKNMNKENITKETFCRGPYCYTRSPTHWGLFFLTLGFGILTNAIFVVILSIAAFVISKLTFLNQEEKLLAFKYGEPYMEYKRSVKM